MTKLVSGIRATGELHIGNYYGAMQGLVDLQKQYDSHYFIADLHSLTTHHQPKKMKKNVIRVAREYLAAGLNPKECTFYVQSSIAEEISELHVYLSMVMPLGDLLRCPTFKEKAKKHPDNVNYGLVGYPVLMAADILIHKGEVVPVGEDQLVHLEITRTIVRRFHQLYGDIFPEPKPLMKNAVRIPSLSCKGKMSKSDAPDTYVSLNDAREMIERKVKKAYSDPKRLYRNEPGHPTKEGCNVFHLHSFFTNSALLEEIKEKCLRAEIGCVECKKLLTNSINAIVEPLNERKKQISDDDVIDILKMGQVKAKQSAQQLISEVRKAMGLQMI
jgi:tryptophanyl-tRNA synthetase